MMRIMSSILFSLGPGGTQVLGPELECDQHCGLFAGACRQPDEAQSQEPQQNSHAYNQFIEYAYK
jgi:hypothetical protein